jgi:hypothetical protein
VNSSGQRPTGHLGLQRVHSQLIGIVELMVVTGLRHKFPDPVGQRLFLLHGEISTGLLVQQLGGFLKLRLSKSAQPLSEIGSDLVAHMGHISITFR